MAFDPEDLTACTPEEDAARLGDIHSALVSALEKGTLAELLWSLKVIAGDEDFPLEHRLALDSALDRVEHDRFTGGCAR